MKTMKKNGPLNPQVPDSGWGGGNIHGCMAPHPQPKSHSTRGFPKKLSFNQSYSQLQMDFCFHLKRFVFHSVSVDWYNTDMKVRYQTSFPMLKIILHSVDHFFWSNIHHVSSINVFHLKRFCFSKTTKPLIVTDDLQIESMKRICRLRLLPPNRDSQFRHRSSTVYALDRREVILLMVQKSGELTSWGW